MFQIQDLFLLTQDRLSPQFFTIELILKIGSAHDHHVAP